jgi:hypothetical protein
MLAPLFDEVNPLMNRWRPLAGKQSTVAEHSGLYPAPANVCL